MDSSLGDIAGVSGAHDRRARAAPLPDVLARRTICWCIRRLLKRFGSRFFTEFKYNSLLYYVEWYISSGKNARDGALWRC